jgi:hypothetical protein
MSICLIAYELLQGQYRKAHKVKGLVKQARGLGFSEQGLLQSDTKVPYCMWFGSGSVPQVSWGEGFSAPTQGFEDLSTGFTEGLHNVYVCVLTAPGSVPQGSWSEGLPQIRGLGSNF